MKMSENCKSYFKEDSIQNLLLGGSTISWKVIREP